MGGYPPGWGILEVSMELLALVQNYLKCYNKESWRERQAFEKLRSHALKAAKESHTPVPDAPDSSTSRVT